MVDDSPAQTPKSPRRKRGWFLLLVGVFNALWALVVLTAVVAVAAVSLLYDRPVVIPAWAETRIQQRLETEFPDVDITFDEVSLLMQEGWRPRVRLRNVAVTDAGGAELLRVSEARIRFSLAALRAGKAQPADVALEGVFATLIREEDGSFSLQPEGGDRARAPNQGPRPGRLVRRIDTVLAQPGLVALERAEIRGLTLQYIDRRAARAFTLDGGRVIAQRNGGALTVSADLAVLGIGGGVTTLAANFNSVLGAQEAQFGVRLDGVSAEDIATQSPAFAWMGALRAPISGALRSGVRGDGTLAPLNATLQIGAGAVQPNTGTLPIPFEGARAYFTYDAAAGLLQFSEMSVRSKWVTAKAEGTASLTGLREGALDALVGQFAVTELHANPMDYYPEPVSIDGAELDFRLQTAPFKLDIGRLDVFDGGQTRHARGTLTAEPEGWHVVLDASTDTIDSARILALWPEKIRTRTRDWLARNLITADILNADFALRLAPDEAPRTFLSFDYQATEVKFLRSLPPVRRARGHASLHEGRFVVALDEGEVAAEEGGVMRVTQSAFILPDLMVRGGTPAVVRINTTGPLPAALWMLDQPPIGAMRRAGLPVALGRGDVRAAGTLSFPLKRGGGTSDVVFDATAQVANLDSTALIKGRRLAADQLRVRADNGRVVITGRGTLEGVPFDGRFEQPLRGGLAKSTASGTVRITQAALDAFNISLPPDTLSGAAQARIAIDLERGQAPRMTLRSDLQGAVLQIPQFGWRKAAGARGALEMDIRLGARPAVTAMTLSGAGLQAEGSVTLAQGGGLDRLALSRLRVGDWLDVRAALEGRGAGRAPQVVVQGGRLDLRTAQFGGAAPPSNTAGGAPAPVPPPAPMRVTLDRLQVTDTLWLQGLAGTFNTAGGLEGPFEARVNGGTGISGRVLPQSGRTAVRITSADAGGVLRSAGVLQQAVGGSLDLSLLPVGTGGAFDGQLVVGDVSIRDAPSMAALVNSLSVVGLVNEMNGDGIYFDEVEAVFRLTPNRLTLTRGSAVGASLGLSMDGVFATDTGQIAMQGVITPVYLLNGIGSLLTRKGEGLLGFNYALSGAASAPDVSINPLSVLAPGGLRDLLRGPKTQAPEVEGASATQAPALPQEPPAREAVERDFEGR